HLNPSGGFQPLSYHRLLSDPLGTAAASASAHLAASLAASPAAMHSEAGLLESRSELMKEHLREIRSLRQRLEDSIQTNDRLRQQLEERLANTAREKGAPTNIYIQGLDSLGQLSGEIRLLKEENHGLQSRLQLANRDGSLEAEQLKETALLAKARLKEAELEAERWAEQCRKLQSEAQTNSQEITQLKQDKQTNTEAVNRLQHEVSVLQQQLMEGQSLVHTLQCELQKYHAVCGGLQNSRPVGPAGSQSGDSSVTYDPKELRISLPPHLATQADTPAHARRQLFNESVLSPPVKDTSFFSPSSSLLSAVEGPGAADSDPAALQGQAPDGSFASRHGRHAVGHASETASVRALLANTKTLQQILTEAHALLRMFWRAALPSSDRCSQGNKQDAALRDARERLRSSNLTKDSMESFIVNQRENSGGFCELTLSPDWGVLKVQARRAATLRPQPSC
ncbi:hypothetical protein CRUP_001553, partial [Coryphaenoides rupestris]